MFPPRPVFPRVLKIGPTLPKGFGPTLYLEGHRQLPADQLVMPRYLFWQPIRCNVIKCGARLLRSFSAGSFHVSRPCEPHAIHFKRCSVLGCRPYLAQHLTRATRRRPADVCAALFNGPDGRGKIPLTHCLATLHHIVFLEAPCSMTASGPTRPQPPRPNTQCSMDTYKPTPQYQLIYFDWTRVTGE